MKLKIKDRVRVLNVTPGGWMGDGTGTIHAYDPSRAHFPGGSPGERSMQNGRVVESAMRGPAICVILDGPAANTEKEKLEVWVTPSPAFIEIIEQAVAA